MPSETDPNRTIDLQVDQASRRSSSTVVAENLAAACRTSGYDSQPHRDDTGAYSPASMASPAATITAAMAMPV